MASLKAFLPVMAKYFATTADALYSRQRALMWLDLLHSTEGRGPGSGVALSADSVAVMVIAMLTADTLAETDERVILACNAVQTKISKTDTDKYFVEERTFRDAVAKIFSDGQTTPSYVLRDLRVSEGTGQIVLIENTEAGGEWLSKTYVPEKRPPFRGPIQRTSEIEISPDEWRVSKLFAAFAEAMAVEKAR